MEGHRAAKLSNGICRHALHTAFFMDHTVNWDVTLADLDVLSADDPWHLAHARQYTRQAATATAAALYAHNHPCMPEFDVEPSDYTTVGVWNGLHTRDAWYSFARTCHECARDIRSRLSASGHTRGGLRQPPHGLHGRPPAKLQHQRSR